ncbi:MAG: PDZ domain-containing protein, partial [Clostridia bacterium]|nr:PDZ domain-containing protein [Clostridia bacterium]
MNNKNRIGSKRLFAVFFSLLTCFCAATGIVDRSIDNSISVFAGEDIDIPSFSAIDRTSDEPGNHKAKISVFGVDFKNVSLSVYDDIRLIPGGMPFGVKFTTDGVLVVGIADVTTDEGTFTPAENGGIKLRDIITEVNGKKINSNEEFTYAVENSDGKELTVTLIRNGKNITAKITPVFEKTEGRYKAGLWVKDSTAGIGTVTYIVPQSGEFGGLGHGVCDTDTGVLMPFKAGNVCIVTISGITKGKSGTPGELRGFFSSAETGILRKNTVCGVFGRFDKIPNECNPPLPISLKDEIFEGPAQIICTTDENSPQVYDIEIVRIIDK